ncbi:MAG: chromosome segregation protein SMC [Candidatus Methylumidiphilus sp.]
MRLDRVKLAGFKSFVDPTSIPLPGNLVGIVGPNGCGKSNIIDAVRWVMGESSAKHLRGESMADVIFNGSSTRKPVGVASVELVFDNSDGAAPGEYAKYREISIKRQVARDGVSAYSLNGTRCRRKDITDIFLGTGLGARSYAIIEQGTISRLIEAKPDELRAVIEEAAGISKYKERRNETEIRMRHTQENLERLNDVREEVAKQIANLQRQAKKAEKYTALKEDERRHRQQLLGLRWRKYDQTLQAHRASLLQCEQQFRELVSAENALAAQQEAAQAQHAKLQQSLNERQGQFYELGAETSRLELAIKHARQTRDNLSRERERLKAEQIQAQAQLRQDLENIEAAREEWVELEADIALARQAEAQATAERQQAEQALKAGRAEWDSALAELSASKARAEVERARIRQIDEQRRQMRQRQDRLASERADIEAALAGSELESLREQLALLEEDQAETQLRLADLLAAVKDGRARAKACQESLNQTRAELHTSQGKISSLELLQQHAMGKDRAALQDWLRRAELDQASRLAEHLDVAPGWESAVETVLGLHLEAVCVDDAGQYLNLLDGGRHPDSMAFFETGRPAASIGANNGSARLLDRVQSAWNLQPLLGGVHRAEDWPQARALCQQLAAHESVVTPDGAWMGPGWMLVKTAGDGKAGVLKRERELRELKARRDRLHGHVGELEQSLSLAEEAVRQAEFEREQRQSEANRRAAEISRLRSQVSAAAARSEQAHKRLGQLEMELDDLEDSLLDNAEAGAEARDLLQQAESAVIDGEQHTLALAGRQQDLERHAAAADHALRQSRDHAHGLQSRVDTLQSTEHLSRKHLERGQAQLAQTGERLAELDRRMDEADAPMDEEQETLEDLLRQRTAVERELAELRKKNQASEAAIRDLSEQRLRKERELEAVKQRLEQTKLDYQGNEVRRQTVQEQFDEIGADPAVVVPGLPEDAEEKEWQQRVAQLAEDISRLGAINLTAMEEYQEQSERLQTLDAQLKDLNESQATLLQAIEKIDRECRARFKDTFERVNAGIQRMFPKLFGGGQAYLEMSERDLLEAGVSIMARPPGKRNSSIHLLSGGEKALTAVALVFSIFELNPAPFCLLDEVDAPLDDANVGRFSQLVKEMAEKVQFLFISHNKVTMEIAQHLAGVTMKEPGVSRIVAVDIDEAVELASL